MNSRCVPEIGLEDQMVMKKLFVTLTAVVLCLCLGSAALGETSLQQKYQFTAADGADFISDCCFLEIGNYSGRALAAMDGTALSDQVYRSMTYHYGYFVTSLESGLGSSGILNAEGQIAVPFEYNDIQALSEVWAVGVRLTATGTKEDHDYTLIGVSGNQYALIETVDLYNVQEGKLMATLTRDEFLQAKANGEILNVVNRTSNTVSQYDGAFQLLGTVRSPYDFPNEEAPEYGTFYEDGKYGLKDAQDNVVIPAQFDMIEDVKYGLVKFRSGDLCGLADLSGNIVLPAEYAKFDYFSGNLPLGYDTTPYAVFGYVPILQDDKVGYYSLPAGALTAEPLYGSSDKAYDYGLTQLRKTDDGAFYIYAADGTETVLEGFQYCTHLNYSLGRYYIVNGEDYKAGLVDWHGKEILPCIYDNITLAADGRSLLTWENETGTVTVYEMTDEFVTAE